jgi:hypothetical protein
VADPNLVAQFCHKLNDDLEGAQIALDLIQHKMQSTQEWEALIALYVKHLILFRINFQTAILFPISAL